MKAMTIRHQLLGLVGLVPAEPAEFDSLASRFRHKLDMALVAAGVMRLEHDSETADLYRKCQLSPELPLVVVLNASSMKVTGETLEQIKTEYAKKSSEWLDPVVAEAIEAIASDIWAKVKPDGVLSRDPRSVDLADCWQRYEKLLRRGGEVSEELARHAAGEASSAFYRMWAANTYEALCGCDGEDYLKRMLGMTYIAFSQNQRR